MAQLLIYIPEITPRCTYTFQTVLDEFLGISFRLTTDINLFMSHQAYKINYSTKRLKDEFFIASHNLLFEKTIYQFSPQVSKIRDMEILFPMENSDLSFDPFAATFYMLSRYEEYLPFEADEHGRFSAGQSLAFQHGFLKKPVVNYWLTYLSHHLKEKFPTLVLKTHNFQPLLTYDIDIALAYKGRSPARFIAAAIKDMAIGDFRNLVKRFRVITNLEKDPFDTYDYINKSAAKHRLPVIYFFLLGDYAKYDKNLPYNKKTLKNIIRKAVQDSKIGIHPSYASNNDYQKIFTEKRRLENISGLAITKSRQHYLRLRFPETYQQLIAAGIREDYTMVFGDQPGFRAGCCYPFRFFNLATDKASNMIIYSPACMDGTFKDQMQISPEESSDQILALINEVRKFNGTFISIWHNSSLSESFGWKDWRKVHEEMLETL